MFTIEERYMARVVKKPEVRREEIVSAAQDLFLRNEYEKTTLQDIMRKVKIAKGTIYHYFTSKEELLEAVVKNMAHQYVSRLRTILERVEGNAMERLQALIVASNMSNEQQ
jgi:AcrR family transcriptional regulator